MKTFKRLFAGLVSLVMAMSLFSVMPAMAEETEEVLDKFELIRRETNLIANPGLEDADVTETVIEGEGEDAKEVVKTYYNERFRSGDTEFVRSDKESYNGDYSILSNKRGGSGEYTIAWATSVRKDATYIASVMALGTQANKAHWDASANKGTQYGSLFELYPAANDYTGNGANTKITSAANVQNVSRADINYTMTAAASSDAEAERAAKDDWKRFYRTFTVDAAYPEVAAIGVGLNIQFQGAGLTEDQKYLEVYTDDYYLAELMVADVQATTPSTITVPAAGSTTVDLTAVAYNQLGNTTGLEDAEYVWELAEDVEGAYINGTQLIVTDTAKAGDFTVRVTCVPTFSGAADQAEKYTKYRSKDVTFTFIKDEDSDFFENLRNSTNLIPVDYIPGVEGDTLWGTDTYYNYCYFTPNYQRSETYEISNSQAYNGNQSLLIKRPETVYINESHFPRFSGMKYNKTIVSSAMILGTEANVAACEANPEASASMKIGTYNTTYFNVLPSDYVLGGNAVKLNTMLDAPASSSTEKASKDKWQMVHSAAAIPSSYTSRYWTGAGVVIDGKGVELFADDYYIGELVVAKVVGTTPKTVYIADEETSVELSAAAYNQLGTTDYFGENTSYDWTEIALPEGVELNGNVLTISPEAEEGKAVLSVTVNPDFMGAEAQTDAQKAARTNTIIIDIKEAYGFEFNKTEEDVTASAYIVNTTDAPISANVVCVLYKVENGAKTLMDIDVEPIEAAVSEEATKVSVPFKAFAFPTDYEYEIECFMWSAEDNSISPIMESVVFDK